MSSSNSWKKFGNETKAGQMLRRLYASKPKISYPKPKARKENRVIRQKPFFVQTNSRADDPREKKIHKIPINVPCISNRKTKKSHLIDTHKGKRKQVSRVYERPTYRPVRSSKEISTSKNKIALRQKFRFGKSRALPQEGLPIPLSPSAPLNGEVSVESKKKLNEHELFTAIMEDIEYRRQCMKRFEELGDFSNHATLQAEIQQKIKDLELMDGLISKK